METFTNKSVEKNRPKQVYRIEITQPKLKIDPTNYEIYTEYGQPVYGKGMKERIRFSRVNSDGKLKVDLNWAVLDSQNDKQTLLHDTSHIFITSYLESIGVKPLRIASELNEFMVIIFNQYCWQSVTSAEAFANRLIEQTVLTVANTYFKNSIPDADQRNVLLKEKTQQIGLTEEEITGDIYSKIVMDYFETSCPETAELIESFHKLKEELENLAKITLEQDKEILKTWDKIQKEVLKDSTDDGHLSVEKNTEQKVLFSKIQEIVKTLEIINGSQNWNDIFDPELNEDEESIYYKLNQDVSNFYDVEKINTNSFTDLQLEQKLEWFKKFVTKTFDAKKIMLLKSQVALFLIKYNMLGSLKSSFSIEYAINKDDDKQSLVALRQPVVENINRIVSSLPAWTNLS